jgi:SSS family solute:Na+ symporter
LGSLRLIDLIVLIVYLIGSVALGCYFVFKNRSSEEFTTGGRSMPGWLVGLSLFGTFVSSISFLALPAKAFTSNWNAFAFSLSLPLAGYITVKFFVPFYRRQNEVSAYGHLEKRFGVWARVYANICYLMMHVVRMGSVMFLLALPLNQLLGWDIKTIILLLGVLTTVYASLGGIKGVIWTDAIQSIVLVTGAVTCAIMLPMGMPHGPAELFRLAAEHHKFSFGSFSASLTDSTFWVVLIYGLFINLQNFGIDQTFVQRYHTACSDREAAKSVWVGALMYIPVSALFFFIGTGLFAYYTTHPHQLPTSIQAQVAIGKGEQVFPYFIVNVLPRGATGLLIAAVFSGAMSTLSSNLNSAATLTFSDFYKRFVQPTPTARQSLLVLHLSTLAWGVIGTASALAMMHIKSGLLDAWWSMAGIFSGGMLGLFLLGMLSRKASTFAGAVAVITGGVVILWLTLSPTAFWPSALSSVRNPLNHFLTIVIGTLATLGSGMLAVILVSFLTGAGNASAVQREVRLRFAGPPREQMPAKLESHL